MRARVVLIAAALGAICGCGALGSRSERTGFSFTMSRPAVVYTPNLIEVGAPDVSLTDVGTFQQRPRFFRMPPAPVCPERLPPPGQRQTTTQACEGTSP